MSPTPTPALPSNGFAVEARAFLDALDATDPAALCACEGWTAHEVVAHLAAAGTEVALNLEAYAGGRPVPATRPFEEREAPYRGMDDRRLRAELVGSIERVGSCLDAVLAADPDAVVPWTGRQMVVASFVTHLASEFALHRWDLVGDDETSERLLADPNLTEHAVAVLGKALVARSVSVAPVGFSAVLAAAGARDVAVVVDNEGPRLVTSEGAVKPAIIGDRGARLLLLWGRRPGDPRRLIAPQGAAMLATLQSLLAGY